MEKVRYPNGSEVNFETFFDDLQSKSFSNLTKRLQSLIDSFGLALTIKNGSYSNQEFQTTLTNSNATVSVNSGSGLTTGGQYLQIDSPLTADNLASSNTNSGYGVVLTYKEVGSQSVKAVNSFVFDRLDGTKSLNRKTRYSDSVALSLEEITGTIGDFKNSLSNDQIVVAAVYDSTGTFSASGANLDNYPQSTSGNFVIRDLREDSRMLLSTSLLDDQVILFKDRPSVGDNKFDQNIEFGQDVKQSGTQTWEDGAGTAYVWETDADHLGLDSSEGNHIRFLQENNTSKTRIPYLQTDEIKVNKGTESTPIWKDVITTSLGNATDPQNLRIYDIEPTNDPHEKYSLVAFRWNYDDINGSGSTGSSSFTLNETSYNNEPIDLNSDSPVGKMLYFPSSNNSYEITGVSYSSPEYTLTLDGSLVSADDSTQAQPARIIDKDIGSYRITIRNVNNGQIYTQELDGSFIKNPKYSVKLELGETWAVSLQALDIGYAGATVSMTGGTYDPDHATGGQGDEVSYGANFVNELPQLASDNEGGVSLWADSQGFIAKVSGWKNGTNGGDAHEYEMIYTSESDVLNLNSFSNLGEGGIERTIVTAGKVHISAGQPTKFLVGVRPLQNKQPVADPIFKEVVSGGGGVLPNDAVLMSIDVDIQVIEAEVQDQDPNFLDEFIVRWFDKFNNRVIPPPDWASGRWLSRTDGSGDPIKDFKVQWHRNFFDDPMDEHRIKIPVYDDLDVPNNERIVSGKSKKDRFIDERSLDIDYRVTKLEFLAKTTTDTSNQDPAIIRVYQEGFENGATTMEVPESREKPFAQDADLPIRSDSNGERILKVDAWDPDPENTGTPNNDCEISGHLTIIGRPIIVDNVS